MSLKMVLCLRALKLLMVYIGAMKFTIEVMAQTLDVDCIKAFSYG